MATMTEEQVEEFCADFIRQCDDAAEPEKMTLEEAIEFWDNVSKQVDMELRMRISAAKSDLGEEG